MEVKDYSLPDSGGGATKTQPLPAVILSYILNI